ncbi:exocyst complex component SEC5A-like isoform X2 [Mangifera indica]|uniref:exocyst complex component SEC5A-like isoform X2 n=1 Tax=Mangifera indica TaxID=29780 RepID=UPI001CFC377A|nr:exocyst complex component SEC5A-like isoform X2 [Mangifera indica]
MSSDSDEDELLQMALEEQAQRDLKYQNPAARKPVANYVQPPKSSAVKTGRPPAKKYQKEEEESEVEMLSISSGDEEVSRDRRFTANNRVRGGRQDDDEWDGEEPNCWKRVDESELARRVREMRETRTAPVAQKYEQKPSSIDGKVLNTLSTLPRGIEWVDPLGLGRIDKRSFTLISEKLSHAPSIPDKEFLDSEKLMYYSEGFDAKLFLSRIHQDTSSADLEAGALALKTDFKGRTQQRKKLVKDNFDCFVSCKTTIDDIESKLKRIEEDPEGSGTSHLFNLMQGVSLQANRAFEPLLERQAQAEKIRSVQGMLQRFRTLFNLPSTIRGSISKGEYDLAVREYKKAKSIALPSHVNILKRVLEEVEKVMQEFKAMLFRSMEDPQIDLTNLENTVRQLLELEPESDPVWHYLNVQNHRIQGLLEKCTMDHEARMETLHNEIRERAMTDARWQQIQQDLNQSSDADYSLTLGNNQLPLDSLSVELNGEEVDALRGRYIRRLTAVLIHQIPAFWKAALSMFSGKFAKSSQVSSEPNSNTSAKKGEDKVGDGRYSVHSLDEVAGMIRNTLSVYEIKVRNTFRDLEESNILRSYMSDAIREISKACQALEVKESAPPIAVMSLRTLQAEITKVYIARLCSWMQFSTDGILKEETWVPVFVLERNKSPYTISYLPQAFRTIVTSAMDQISLMIQSLRTEATKSEDIFVQLQEIQESVRLSFLNRFLDFAGHLEHVASELAQNKLTKENSILQNGSSSVPFEELSSDIPGSVVDPHQRLLIVLSNIGYCKAELSSELYNKYKHIWHQSRENDHEDSDIQDLVMSFSGLEEKVLEQYTFAKANLIRSAATAFLLDSGVQWGAAPAVKGVRDVVVELLHTLVAVHAEVFAGAKPLLDKTLGILVEGLIDTFLSLIDEHRSNDLKSLDANGFCQLMLELEYLETILNPYLTPIAMASLKSLQGVLLEKATESASEAVENPGHHRRSTRGSEDALADERQQGMTLSPDDLIAFAQQYSTELLQAELERTRINTACFVESISMDSLPETTKAAYAPFQGSMDASSRHYGAMDSPSRNYRGAQPRGSPSFSRQRRR